MRSFAALAAGPCPSHEDLLLAAAAELGPVDVPAASARIAALAGALPEPGGSAEFELAAVAALPVRPRAGGAVTLPEVLACGTGDPVGVAAALSVAAARRGLRVDVVGHGRNVWLAHPDGGSAILDPATGRLVDGRRLGVDLHWRCAHELTHLTLELLIERAERCGDLGHALQLAELTSDLPLEEHPAPTLARVRARLN